MSELFLKIINMSIAASWLVLVVLAFRFLFRKAPKWVNVLLWGIVAVRLICPFSIESALSLIPSAETIPLNIEMDITPAIDSGISSVNALVNPMLSGSNTPANGASVNPLQITVAIYANIWILGVLTLLVYAAVSYWRLQRKVSEAVILRDNIYQSENVASPFVLGIIKPKVYLPYNMDGQDLEHVVAHEYAHICRRDHWWKPLGFLLLTIHWFNPLMWLAYVLLCRDIELACDEKVIKEMGNERRADYTQALVSCSVNRRMIAACPLAFGEVGVKERVKSVMNYKKPAFWVIVASIITCAVVAICFLTNPAAEREFPINGSNVSELDTERVVEMISRAEKLEDGSQLCMNEDGFDLMFTSDFDWANDGAIRFFYMKNQKTYSAQLRMFHDENKYFITDTDEWIEQEQIFKLLHYLDALKYMPQEQIRQLSPDADGYSVLMRHEGTPSDYDRVLKYSRNGVNANDGWYIHLEVQPLHKVEGGGYNGSGNEVIHLFYNSGNKRDDIAGKTYLYEKEGIMGSFTITLYEDGTFTYYEGMASSYIGDGTFMLDGDTVVMTDDGPGGYGLVNRFRRDGDDLVFVEQDSDNFIYVKVQDGERFHCTGEAFKPVDAITQPGGGQTLSLDDVVTLSQKGHDLTWADFEQYKYSETGSGLYIQRYEINDMFNLWIGGTGPDDTPMYIYLSLADDLDTRIDIRDGGVKEFITKDHSETLLNKAIYDAIINCNLSEKTVGLNNCASFIMLDKEEISGTPVAGSTDHVGMVTVYGLALYQGYDLVDNELREEAGSHTPVAITFDVLNGKYSLKEYWRPGDGTYYEPDIREKFPDKIEDEAMNTQKYIAAQKQECYVQAMRHNGVEVSDPNQQSLSAEEQVAVNAIFTNLRTDWWNGKQAKNCVYESAAFECLHREKNGNIVNLYGYGGYFRWDRSKTCIEQWYAPTIVTLDTDTQQVLDLWWPGDGAFYESSILEKFPESIASTVAEPDSGRSAAVRAQLMEASKKSMVSANQLSESGQTRRFVAQDLRVEITNVLSTHKTALLAEGIELHEYVVVSCTPESKITILNPGMSDPTYAEDGKPHPKWGLSYTGEAERTRITDETKTVPVTTDLEGIYNLEASLFVIQLNQVD